MTPKVVHEENLQWDYVYEWSCEDVEVGESTIQIKAYAEYPITTTTEIDLFNRFPIQKSPEVVDE
tara:strand:+ start:380 stop:574 length:195 start_codon:yes stop_codon:yes gene_type:complete